MFSLSNVEITLMAVLVAALIFLTQLLVIVLKRQSLERDDAILEKQKAGQGDELSFAALKRKLSAPCCKPQPANSIGFVSLVIFNLLMFLGFTTWTVFLVQQNLGDWAVLTGIYAFVSFVMPLILWLRIQERNSVIEALQTGIASYEADQTGQGQPVQIDDLTAVSGMVSPPTMETTSVSINIATASPKPAATLTAPMPAATGGMPEDSVLKRHYLQHLAAEREAITHPYPTDSVLRRHYEAMRRSQLGFESAAGAQPVVQPLVASDAAVMQVEPAIEDDAHLPEDSVLKRHFLSKLRTEIEAMFTAATPTDSVLRRHYENLINNELEKRLGMMH